MGTILGFLSLISGLLGRILSIRRPRPRVAIEAEYIVEEGGGTSNVGGTAWNVWKDIYLRLCVTNTGAPTTIKNVFISIKDGRNEVLRFLPWKVLEYVQRKQPSKSPELKKVLIGSRIDTNDCWGPDIVLFTTSKIVNGEKPRLPDGERLLTVEVVGQRLKDVKF